MRRTDKETESPEETPRDTNALLKLATGLVSAYVGNNHVPAASLGAFISGIHASLAQMGTGAAGTASKTPAVPIKHSITDAYIVCLEDGKKLKMLKRYLRTHFQLSPEEYRATWGLPRDYPMVAPAYAQLRSNFAKKSGLGRIPAGSPRRSRRTAAR